MIRSAKLRADGNYDVDAVSDECGLLCEDISLAVQSQADDADINVIVKRFGLTGELPLNKRVPLPADLFIDGMEYRECLEAVMAAQASFASLPAVVRSTFENDAEKFVAFAEDPANLAKLREWGLAPPAPEAPQGAVVTP